MPAPMSDPVALDILLLPGPRLAAAAAALNAGLVAAGHGAITFGPFATAHLTLAQLFVAQNALAPLAARLRAEDLPAASAGLPLAATSLGAAAFAGSQAVSILIETTPELLALHDRVRALAAPFAVPGTAAGFLRAPGAPDIHPGTVSYASDFLTRHAGPDWAPHVTVGLAPGEAAAALLARPFEPLTEPAAGLGLWHLGEYGTAAAPLDPLA